MKKIIVMIFMFGCFLQNISADSVYYENSKGVTFTKDEYDFLSNFYFEGYQEYMTVHDYQEFISSDIMNGEIKIARGDDFKYMPRDVTDYNDGKKIIQLSTSCQGSTCTAVSTLTWISSPDSRSYDLFGVLVENTSIISRYKSMLYSSVNIDPVYQQTYSNAFSSTYKLPVSGTINRVVEQYKVQNSGKVITSYQHAVNNVSLESSYNYLFATNGCGGIFVFHQNVRPSYDCMLGVYLLLG